MGSSVVLAGGSALVAQARCACRVRFPATTVLPFFIFSQVCSKAFSNTHQHASTILFFVTHCHCSIILLPHSVIFITFYNGPFHVHPHIVE